MAFEPSKKGIVSRMAKITDIKNELHKVLPDIYVEKEPNVTAVFTRYISIRKRDTKVSLREHGIGNDLMYTSTVELRGAILNKHLMREVSSELFAERMIKEFMQAYE